LYASTHFKIKRDSNVQREARDTRGKILTSGDFIFRIAQYRA